MFPKSELLILELGGGGRRSSGYVCMYVCMLLNGWMEAWGFGRVEVGVTAVLSR